MKRILYEVKSFHSVASIVRSKYLDLILFPQGIAFSQTICNFCVNQHCPTFIFSPFITFFHVIGVLLSLKSIDTYCIDHKCVQSNVPIIIPKRSIKQNNVFHESMKCYSEHIMALKGSLLYFVVTIGTLITILFVLILQTYVDR